SSTMAPSSLIFTVIVSPPAPPAPPSATSGLHSSSSASSLRPSGYVRLLLSSGSTLVLCRFCPTAAFQISVSASVTGAIHILSIAMARQLFTLGSTTTCSAVV
ncbi:hypothetical protein M9458_026317, partial [Cirrhinus mrigala]